MNGTENCTNGRAARRPVASFELGEIRPSSYFFGLAGALGVLLGLVTQGDLTGAHLLLHLLQWQLQAYSAMAILIGTHLLLLRWRFFHRRLGEWWQLLCGGFLGALVFSLPALALDLLFRADPIPEHASELLRSWWGELGGVLPSVTLTWLAANAPWVVGFRMVQPSSPREPVRSHTSVPDAPRKNTRFWTLIDGTDPVEIRYLKAELQYVRIVTTSREHLVLYSLRDAVAELPPSFGVQTHRSYWVAFAAVASFRHVGRQGDITLRDGTLIPVSRSRMKAVQALLSGNGN